MTPIGLRKKGRHFCASANRQWLALACLMLGGHIQPAFAQAAPPTPPPPEWNFIAFETKSWGEPLSSWRLLNNGGGSWTEAVKAKGQSLGSYLLVWHEIEPNVQNYIAIERILRGLPHPAPDFNRCANRMSDMPYGTIRLTSGATTIEIAWNSGCLDESYQSFLNILKDADGRVRALGKAGKVLRTEAVP